MEDKLEKAANDELIHSYTTCLDGEFVYPRNAMLNMFRKGAQWRKPYYNKAQKCPVCEGKGYINVGGSYSIATTVCPTCKGNRIIYIK